MTLGERIIGALASHGERGAYFDYGAYGHLRQVDSVAELRALLDEQGYDEVAESDDPAAVVENLRVYRLGPEPETEPPLARRASAWSFAVTFLTASFNGVVWWAASLGIKGDAATGMISDGRCYLGWKNGQFTEVTESVFRYSLIHTRITWLLFGIALAALAVHLLLEFVDTLHRRNNQADPGT